MSARDQILAIIRRALDRGQPVEIDGLGVFRPRQGDYELVPQRRPQVFVAYVAEDLARARRLCDALAKHACAPWLDKDKLLPGQDWPRAIRRAVQVSDAFVACFSHRSISKRGQFQNELRWALECARLRPLDGTFLIPVRLEPCEVPRGIAERLQYVDLFPDWDAGLKKLLRAIRRAARTGGKPQPRLISSGSGSAEYCCNRRSSRGTLRRR